FSKGPAPTPTGPTRVPACLPTPTNSRIEAWRLRACFLKTPKGLAGPGILSTGRARTPQKGLVRYTLDSDRQKGYAGSEAMGQHRTHAVQQTSPINQLVGALLEEPGHVQAERLGGLEVHDHLVFHRKLHREIARLRAAQNAIDVAGGATKGVYQVGSVREQTAVSGEVRLVIDRRYVVSGRRQ